MTQQIIIISLVSYGYCACFWDGMIFNRAGIYLQSKLPEWLCKPLFACAICNAFWMGTTLYWTLWHHSILQWAVVSVGAIGFNAIVVNLINKIDSIVEVFSTPQN